MRSEPTRKEELAWQAILDNALLARRFVAGVTLERFTEDRMIFYAVTRCLEIISEAARRLRGSQQDAHPTIRWRQIEDSGNVFRHVYQTVEESRVLAIVHNELGALIDAARDALGETTD
jgi:uncharacterized protein with HEPN domain